jgi:CRISPR-associated protein Cmr5
MTKETIITKLEKGRAEFAYRCAEEGKKIIKKTQIDGEWYEDDKYKSYVKKIPSMILSNGLGQTLAYVLSKKQKIKEGKLPGSRENPKNAYDLIYKQLTEYIISEHTTRITPDDKKELIEKKELVKWVIDLESSKYKYITQEILAFLNWLKRFAEGLIEVEEEGE